VKYTGEKKKKKLGDSLPRGWEKKKTEKKFLNQKLVFRDPEGTGGGPRHGVLDKLGRYPGALIGKLTKGAKAAKKKPILVFE